MRHSPYDELDEASPCKAVCRKALLQDKCAENRVKYFGLLAKPLIQY